MAADAAPEPAAVADRAEVADKAADNEEKSAYTSYAIPAAEILGFDFLLNRYNHRFSGVADYDVTMASIRRNLRGPWVVDDDPFKINQFGHPYQGSIYHGAARSAGLGYWEASAYAFAGSAAWEIAGEQTPPSRNDQVASGIAGSFLGEPLFRMARLVVTGSSALPQVWRDWAAAAISPAYGFNRLVYGERFEGAFDDHGPLYYSSLRVGADHAVGPEARTVPGVRPNSVGVDFRIDYGLPGQPGYTYRRPFDYFALRAAASSGNGVDILSTRGLLVGTDYALGDNGRGIWGLYGNYDYVAPPIFHVSTTALSIGSTAQWWLFEDMALQGSLLAGLGYSAASTSTRPLPADTNYHYGMAPRLGLDLQWIVGSRVTLAVDAQEYFLGRIAHRAAGYDDIARIDTALTWRVQGRHAVGVKFLWSHRVASFPATGAQGQTLGSIGIYYTLLGEDRFGTVDWRGAAAR